MNNVRIDRVAAASSAADALRAARIVRRAVELVARQLSLGDTVLPVPKLVLDLHAQPGMSEEQMARKIARELAAKLL